VAYLASHPHSGVERAALIELLWHPQAPGVGAEATFAALLSKTRTVLAPAEVRGRASLQLVLPPGSLVDAERAASALHRAQAASAAADWRRAWAQALSAVFVTQREFLPEFDGDWVVRRRAAGRQMHADATACYACACLELGGAELASAERAARRLVELEPLAERGYWLLMRALARRGDQASALLVYERLRVTLREELGVAPSPTISELHATLL
jgi:DNA-binding SARP family transcriptional activator